MAVLTTKQRAFSGFYLGLLLIAVSLYMINARAFVIYSIAGCIYLTAYKIFGKLFDAQLRWSGDKYRMTFMDSSQVTGLLALIFLVIGIVLAMTISSLAAPAIFVSLSMVFLDQSMDVKFTPR